LTGCLHSSEEPSEESDTGKVPEDIEGLRLWLHPDSGTVTGDGGVETWRDDSGNGYDLTQEETGLQPSLVEDAVEGNPALRFDGEEDHLLREDALGIPDEGARTFVVVSRLTDLGARSPFLTQGTFGSSGGGSNFYGLEANSFTFTFRTSGERFGLYLVSVAKDSELATDTNYNVHILRTADSPELSSIEESTTYYVNGEEVPFGDTPGGTRNSPFEADSTAVGTFPGSSPSSVMHGEIAEIQV